MEWVESAVGAKYDLQFVLDAYFTNSRNVEVDSLPPDPEHSDQIETGFCSLISEMVQAADLDHLNGEPQGPMGIYNAFQSL